MKSREPVEVTIESVADDGCGYSADGRQAVYGSLEGETVIASPLARKRKRLYLKTTDVITASSERVVPKCEAAAHCGGCSFQHMDHASQLQMKSRWLEDALGVTSPHSWLPPVVGPAYGYRSKARLGVRYVEKKQRVLVGFREKMKPYITDTRSCPILVRPADVMISSLADLVAGLSQPRTVPQIEFAAGDEQFALVFRHLEPLSEQDLANLESFGEEHQVWIYLQPGSEETTTRLSAPGDEALLQYTLPDFDLTFEFSPQDFTQVNLEVNRQMVSLVVELLEPERGDRVLDAFCGIGNFSLAIARQVGHVHGVEFSPASIDRAKHNARLNSVENATFETGDLQAEHPEINSLEAFNKIVLDPPRSGAESLVKKVASSNVEKVVYVSCNPGTLARDVNLLVGKGFELRSAGIIDMFPHTTHIESIAILTRPGQS